VLFVKVLFVFFVLDYISLFLCRLSFVGLVFFGTEPREEHLCNDLFLSNGT